MAMRKSERLQKVSRGSKSHYDANYFENKCEPTDSSLTYYLHTPAARNVGTTIGGHISTSDCYNLVPSRTFGSSDASRPLSATPHPRRLALFADRPRCSRPAILLCLRGNAPLDRIRQKEEPRLDAPPPSSPSATIFGAFFPILYLYLLPLHFLLAAVPAILAFSKSREPTTHSPTPRNDICLALRTVSPRVHGLRRLSPTLPKAPAPAVPATHPSAPRKPRTPRASLRIDALVFVHDLPISLRPIRCIEPAASPSYNS
jgi:hypothetical protein